MTALEDRLSSDLPTLAEAMMANREGEGMPVSGLAIDHGRIGVDVPSIIDSAERPSSKPARGLGWGKAAALMVVGMSLAGLGVLGVRSVGNNSGREVSTEASAAGDEGEDELNERPGTWSTMSEAPIEQRPLAASAWTGGEAVFWAGSSLDRLFAYGDGAAYDPSTDSWRTMDVPGWGHPGLSTTFFEGEFYAAAKGGFSTLNPTEGSWSDLPSPEGMFVGEIIATDDAVWALGTTTSDPQGDRHLAIARYEPNDQSWVDIPQLDLGSIDEFGEGWSFGSSEHKALWTGSEIVVWQGLDVGLAFDPASETWRHLPFLRPPTGSLVATKATVTDAGLIVIVEVDHEGQSLALFATLDGDSWNWLASEVPVADFESVSIAGAGDWIMVFSAEQAPVSVHIPSGDWLRHEDGPLLGVKAPNTVWTGESLIVWGGVESENTDNSALPAGAVWTPPDS